MQSQGATRVAFLLPPDVYLISGIFLTTRYPPFLIAFPVKSHLRTLITIGIETLRQHGTLPEEAVAHQVTIERPKNRQHGDFACTVALQLAKTARCSPRTIAHALIQAIPADAAIAHMEVAGPGFINFHLHVSTLHHEIMHVLQQDHNYGRSDSQAGQRVGVEYVSANPTGPLHVGHGRAAAIGDSLARLLDAQGWSVAREFYYNDAGVQIDALTRSVRARIQKLAPGDPLWPQNSYNGEYIQDIATAYCNGESITIAGHTTQGMRDPDDENAIRKFAVAYLRQEQNRDLAAFGVDFDVYFLESALYSGGKVQETVDRLTHSGHTYEHEGALWLRSSNFGDDKDRVMRKSDGTYTYFVPDIAYHWTKWERGYLRAITELGADHHGSLKRVQAGLQALNVGIPSQWPEYVLHQMVTVMRGGQEVKLSKRAGSYVTLRDLIEETSADAVRWFLVARKPDSQLTFDIDLAKQQTAENPVFYVQYAHARACSLFRQAQEKHGTVAVASSADALILLTDPTTCALMSEISRFPETVASAAHLLEPHLIAQYLRDLAYTFHTWYHDTQVLVDDIVLRTAKLTLVRAVQITLKNGLYLLGISSPLQM